MKENLYEVKCYRCGHTQRNIIKELKKHKFACKNTNCRATRKLVNKNTNELTCCIKSVDLNKRIRRVI